MLNKANEMVLSVHHKTMTLKQLLQRLRVDASLADISLCKEDLTIEGWAETVGLAAESTSLQAAVTRFRRANGLFTAAQASEWLEYRGMTLEDLVDLLRPPVLKEALARHFVTDDEIQRLFLESASQYDRAEISLLVTGEFGAAQELLFRVEEGSDFHALARRYSSDPATAKSGGYAGLISRADLEPEIAAAVFHAAPGTLLGPFERKHEFCLILVEEQYPAELNETVAASLREQLFQYKLEAYQHTLEIREHIWNLGEG
ncbi:peptidylprolyl isomerase [Paenibacillus sp. TAB 01]|uniref:peptidylprolyl isomerase n=1 Tax=Paenibacillus sp. TAB 01 TaxID=3368988 RepID=UPI003752B5D3